MNQKNKKISIFYNGFTFLFLLIGILYVYLADISMGFARDLIYREYFVRENILVYINEYIISLIWLIPFFYSFYNNLTNKDYSLSSIVNTITFFLVIIFSLVFINEYIVLWIIFGVFAILRLPLLLKDKKCIFI